MRIKSYFAPSVQSAIAIARREFGDDVTLVTSHAAALESRHLGDYEVVFAVEEAPSPAAESKNAAEPKKAVEPKKNVAQVIKATEVIKTAESVKTAEPVKPVADPLPVAILEAPVLPTLVPEPARPVFQDLLQEAITTPLSTEENLPEKLERVQSILVEMGIDGPMVRALMTMIERSVAVQVLMPPSSAVEAESEITAEPVVLEAEAVATEPDEPANSLVPDLTPAELAFYLSVSVGS